MINEVYFFSIYYNEDNSIEVSDIIIKEDDGDNYYEINGSHISMGDNGENPGWQKYSIYGKEYYCVYKLDLYQFTNYENDDMKDFILDLLHEYLLSTKRIKKLDRLMEEDKNNGEDNSFPKPREFGEGGEIPHPPKLREWSEGGWFPKLKTLLSKKEKNG